MKQFVMFVLMGALAVTVSACGSQDASSVKEQPETQSEVASLTKENNADENNGSSEENVVDKNTVTSSQDIDENEEAVECQEVNFGDTITTDFLEMTVDSASMSEELLPTDTSGVYSYQADEDGEKYFFLTGTMKNIGGAAYDVEDTYVEMVFDGKYTYTGYVKADDGGNDFYGNNVKPFESVKYYLVASIPDELLEQYATCKITFGFTENFDSYRPSYGYKEECDYLYEITVSK